MASRRGVGSGTGSGSGSGSLIRLAIRLSSGRKLLGIDAKASGTALKQAIAKELGSQEDFVIKRDVGGRPGEEVKILRTSNLSSLKLKNGDVLYITPKAGTRFSADQMEEGGDGGDDDGSTTTTSPKVVVEDPVDLVLRKQDGRIVQPRSKHCQHNNTSQCLYCSAKEPYDEEYLKQEGIKHMSFHSYLRKLSSGMSKDKYVALENLSCQIKKGCTTHKPWPASICSTCQPPAITLNRQSYRHIDNVLFENAGIMDQFLDYWRVTGHQRIGFMFGKYEVFPEVPLGIKAVVSAIYEPPQEGGRDGIKLVDDAKTDALVDEMARALGLKRVGWIFTDLIPDSKGNVKHFRNVDSHFVSAQECIMAGHFQSKYPNPTKNASEGYFGSKFATVLVTGDKDKQIHMEGYQVSNQCMALARDQCLIPTKDAPELGYVLESTSEKYVPDVFFKEKDKYGNEVTKLARPLPVEYLLIDVPVATPKEPVHTFHEPANKADKFPVENRPMEGHIQDLSVLATYRQKCHNVTDFFRDFHVLLFLATQTTHPIYEFMGPLLEAVREKKTDAVLAWANSEHWQTLELLMEAHNGGFS